MPNIASLARCASALLLGLCAQAAHAQTPDYSCANATEPGGGRHYQVVLESEVDGVDISFELFEPDAIDCARIGEGGAHPLLLQGHGYGGSRSTGDGSFGNYREAGFAVISIDQRGFGASGGTVRVMDPDFEAKDLIQILDWAEDNLDYLAYRDGNLLSGAIGGSYGGGYQMLLLMTDPEQRLDAIAPDITWHDLRYSLNPGDVVKTAWDLLLSGAGEAAASASSLQTLFAGRAPLLGDGQDPFIKETLARGAATNEFPRQALDWFRYHSLSHWCAAADLPHMEYPFYEPDAVPLVGPIVLDPAGFPGDNVPPQADGRPGFGSMVAPVDAATHFAGLDVLITQGMPDTLFNFNEAWWNTQCLQAAGAEVSLYTHNTGHLLPALQGGGNGRCNEGTFEWLSSRLLPNGNPAPRDEVCFALGDDSTVSMAEADVLAAQPEAGLRGGEAAGYTQRSVTSAGPLPNGPLAVPQLATAQPAVLPLGAVFSEGMIAGIAQIDLTVSSLTGGNELVQDCSAPAIPLLRTGCDSVLFVGLGVQPAGGGGYTLLESQLTPLRGLGQHDVELVGVAERLNVGDELALLIFSEQIQFFGSVSRDLTIPAVTVAGDVALPIYGFAENGAPDALLAGAVLGEAGVPADIDGDGLSNDVDNCPNTANADQADADGDGIGDVCDTQDNNDDDADGVENFEDACGNTPPNTAVDGKGCTAASSNLAVTLSADPTEGDVTDGPLTVTFTVTPSTDDEDLSGEITYVYYFGDGSNSGETTETSISHDYTDAGRYTATVAASDENLAAAQDSVEIVTRSTVTVAPSRDIVIDGSDLVCTLNQPQVPATLTCDASSAQAPDDAVYDYDFGDGNGRVSTNPVVVHTYLEPGSYNVTLEVRDPQDPTNFGTAAAAVSVGDVQQTTALLTVAPTRAVAGVTEVTLDASGSIAAEGTTIEGYEFDPGDGNGPLTPAAGEASVVYVYPEAGEYEPSVTVTDSAGNTATVKTLVRVDRAVDPNPPGEPPVQPPGRSSGSGATGGLLLLAGLLLGLRRRLR